MSRIISYPYDSNVVDDDAWIGTEASTTRTKQYTASAVADYLNINGKISIGGQMVYQYVANPLQAVGTFSITSGGLDNVLFANITTLTLSMVDRGGQNVVAFLNYLVGSDILISKQNEISSFGHYEVVSYNVNPNNSQFYDLVVVFKGGNGSMNFLDFYDAINFTLASEIVGSYTFNVDSDNGVPFTVQNNDTIDFTSTNITVSNVNSAISFNLPVTGVTAGAYTAANITVDSFGRITDAADGASGPGGTGTTNFVTKWVNATTLGDSVIFDNGTNVGIGTTAPTAPLQIGVGTNAIALSHSNDIINEVNSISIRTNSSADANIDFRKSGNIYYNTADLSGIRNFTIYEGKDSATAVVTITGGDNVGNVGIGTTTPTEKLEVIGKAIIRRTGTATAHSDTDLLVTDATAAGSTAQLEILGGNLGNSFLYFSDTDSYQQGGIQYQHSSDSMNFRVNASTAVSINSSRNVGIGTTSPSSKLHVEGTLQVIETNSITAEPNGSRIIAAIDSRGGTDTGGLGIYTGDNNNDEPALLITNYLDAEKFRILGASGDIISAGLIRSTAYGSGNVTGTATYNLSVDSSGNVIETAAGGGGSSNWTLTGNDIYNNNSGNVGIGTTSPSNPLHIRADAPSIRLEDITSSDNHYLTGNNGELRIQSTGFITMRPGNTVSTAFLANGNVGIGTISPNAKLTVRGSSLTSEDLFHIEDSGGVRMMEVVTDPVGNASLQIKDTSGSTKSLINSAGNSYLNGGNVGIGTTSPEEKLHVIGNTLLSNNNAYRIERADGANIPVVKLSSSNVVQFGAATSTSVATMFDFRTSGDASKMVILGSGNVGIGNTSPSAKLDIASPSTNTVPFRVATSNGVSGANFYEDTSGYLWFQMFDPSANEKVRIRTNSSSFFNGGNVGIGTTSPSEKLDVAGNITLNYTGVVSDSNQISMVASRASFGYDGSIGSAFMRSSDTSKPLVFGSGSSELMRIVSSSGNVGIGTTSPSEKLHVDGNARVTGAYYDTSNSPGTTDQILSSTVTGTTWIDPSTITAEAATLVVIACKNTSGATITKGTPVYQTGTVGATATIEIAPADALISANKLPAIGLLQTTLNANGIGKVVITGELTNFTTSPIDGVVPTTGDKVFVKSGGGLTLTKPTGEGNGIQNMGLVGKVSSGNAGSITVSSIMRTNDVPNLPEGRIWVGDGNTIVSDTVYVDEPNNRVGIGTDSPSEKLEVNGGEIRTTRENVSANYLSLSTTSAGSFIKNAGGTSKGLTLDNVSATSPYINFKLLSSEKMRIDVNGNVGIGTTSPIAKLHVDGDARVDSITFTGKGFLATDSSGINLESVSDDITLTPYGNTIISSGNVGIGTTSPNAKLTVRGSSLTSEDLFHIEDSGGVRMMEVVTDPVGNASLQIKDTSGSTKSLINSAGYSYLNGGNVGIGTTSPLNSLQVSGGSVGIDSRYMIRDNRNNTILLQSLSTAASNRTLTIGNATYNNIIIPNGNVGIGTTSPSEKLDVAGNAIFRGDIVSRDTYPSIYVDHSGTVMGGIRADATNKLELKTLTTAPIVFQVNSSEKIRILDNGNVGIGTTSPQATLDVNGPIKVGTAQTLAASSTTVGAIRYRATTGASYMEMVMQTGVSGVIPVFAWVIIKENNW